MFTDNYSGYGNMDGLQVSATTSPYPSQSQAFSDSMFASSYSGYSAMDGSQVPVTYPS